MEHDHLVPVGSLVGAQIDAGPAAGAEMGVPDRLVELLLPHDLYIHAVFLLKISSAHKKLGFF
jgi:hypothetical protein